MNLPEGPFHPNGTPKLQDAYMVNVAADAMLKRLAQKRDEGASGWQVVFLRARMPEHFSVNEKLMPLVRQFISDSRTKATNDPNPQS